MTNKINFTAEQKRALQLDKNLLVTAGAGSGKTAVLTERYYRILEKFSQENSPASLNKILVLTFTEKAAGEMKERIFKKIQGTVLECMGNNREGLSSWQAYQDNFLENKISTFHSFCAYLLRSFPLEAQIDPDYQVIEGFEQWLLVQEILDRDLNRRAQINCPDLSLLLKVWTRRQTLNVLSDMLNRRNVLYPWLDFYKDQEQERILERWFNLASFRLEELFSPQGEFLSILGALANMASLPIISSDQGMAFICTLADFYDNLPQMLEDVNEYEKAYILSDFLLLFLDSKGEYKKFKHFSQVGTKGNWADHQDEHESYKALAQDLVSILMTYVPLEMMKYLPSLADKEHAKYLQALAKIYASCLGAYQNAKNNNGQLDFTDLEYMAHQLLLNHEKIRLKLAERFRYIMVDEFQDTNNTQWEIIKALAKNQEGELASDKIFLVGDAKQAIYSFRGGDVRVFTKAQEELAQRGNYETVVFEDNFRSAELPIAFFNSFFSDLMGSEGLADYEASFQALNKANSQKTDPGGVSLSLLVKEGDRLFNLEEEAKLVAQKTQESLTLLREHKGKNPKVAILLRRLTNVRFYAEALRRQGISASIVQGKGFYEQQEIYDLFNLLSFLTDQEDDIALAGALRSPLLTLADNQLWLVSQEQGPNLWQKLRNSPYPWTQELVVFLEKWLYYKERLSIANYLRLIIDDSHFYLAQGLEEDAVQKKRNLGKFLELARKFDKGGSSLGDFKEYIAQQIQLSIGEGQAATDADAEVVIMSIHQSKGLEFPAVILPDLGSQFNFGLADSIYIEEVGGKLELAMTIPHPRTSLPRDTVLRKQMKELMKGHSLAEEKRILYVATTRAEYYLHLIAIADENKEIEGKELVDLNSFLLWFLKIYGLNDWEKVLGLEGKLDLMDFQVLSSSDLIYSEKTSKKEEDFRGLAKKLKDHTPQIIRKSSLLLPLVREISPTALTIYKECPLRYKYRALGLPKALLPTKLPGDFAPQEGPILEAARLGEMFHKILEEGSHLLSSMDNETLIKSLFPPGEVKIYQTELDRHLTNLKASNWLKRMLEAEETFEELPFRYLLYQDEQNHVYLKGIVDKLIKEEEGWRILDFKTSKVQGKVLEEVAKEYNYDLQIHCYNLALGAHLREENLGELVEGVLIFTETAESLFLKKDPRKEEEIIGLVQRILAEDFRPRTGDYCRYCEYSTVCPLQLANG